MKTGLTREEVGGDVRRARFTPPSDFCLFFISLRQEASSTGGGGGLRPVPSRPVPSVWWALRPHGFPPSPVNKVQPATLKPPEGAGGL